MPLREYLSDIFHLSVYDSHIKDFFSKKHLSLSLLTSIKLIKW